MLIYLVDNTIDGQGASPRELRAVLGRLRPEVEILTEPFAAVSLDRVRSLSPSHIILSGQSHPWDDYSSDSLRGVLEVIHQASQPILGVCGGHQQIALAYGAPVGLMERLEPGDGYQGAKRERGYYEVETTGGGVFKDLPAKITVWHSHCDEVKEMPPIFKLTATNETCRIQAMQHEERPLFGVQFHPELFNAEFPAGQTVIENFLAL
ncbi:MAG: gamma-glutamyl-gamma-aminobutyrate hydrolase family protein [Pyrinomonadaceae bacterium]|nr:gamma-glutamyl-gamma-aminobutyrate hydrolase family protein [Pyrinomonadaceae bacterium]